MVRVFPKLELPLPNEVRAETGSLSGEQTITLHGLMYSKISMNKDSTWFCLFLLWESDTHVHSVIVVCAALHFRGGDP